MLRWVTLKGRGTFDENGRCRRVIGVAFDATARMRRLEACEQAGEGLRDRFIAVLGHDLRSPLSSVAMATRLLLSKPEQADMISSHIQRSIARMTGMIEDILDFARARMAGGLAVSIDGAAPLGPVLQQVIDELVVAHPEKTVTPEIDLPDVVRCDHARFAQLFLNFLANAIAHSEPPAAPIRVRARAEGGQAAQAGQLVAAVRFFQVLAQLRMALRVYHLASLGHLGRTEEAEAVIEKLRESLPGFSLSTLPEHQEWPGHPPAQRRGSARCARCVSPVSNGRSPRHVFHATTGGFRERVPRVDCAGPHRAAGRTGSRQRVGHTRSAVTPASVPKLTLGMIHERQRRLLPR